jgi:hypothetical protein
MRSGGREDRDMDGQEPTGEDAGADRPKGGRTRKRPPGKPVEVDKRSLNLRVDEATYQRLTVHAMMRKTTISELVMGFAREHLREFSIHRNGARQGGEG